MLQRYVAALSFCQLLFGGQLRYVISSGDNHAVVNYNGHVVRLTEEGVFALPEDRG